MGSLIESCNLLDVPSDLRSLRGWMQNGRPTADEALQKIKEYRHKLDEDRKVTAQTDAKMV